MSLPPQLSSAGPPQLPLSLRWRGRVLAIVLATLLVGAMFWFWFRPPEMRHWWPQCIFYRWTGFLCPGCGGTRALRALLAGDFGYAMRCNALTTLLLPILPVLFGRWMYKLWNGAPASTLSGYIKPCWLYAAAATLMIFMVLRNIPLAVFDVLRPM